MNGWTASVVISISLFGVRPLCAQTVVAPTGAAVAGAYVAIQPAERISWIVDGVVGPRTWTIGVLAAGSQTVINTPEEWQRTWGGFGKRFLEREADVAISNSIEAGVGAIWGEDPRYLLSHRRGAWPRVSYALKTVLLAPRPDGRLEPAWGRLAGNVFNNVIENAWLPPSQTTAGQTTLRSAGGLVSRAVGNIWDEFEPDLRRLVHW